MSGAEPLDTLLVKLNDGEDAAAAEACRAYEPYLRALVRRRLTPALRAKFDSLDVVQSAWAGVLGGYRAGGWQFGDRDHLRAFLARVTANHFFTQCRRHRPALDRERPMPGAESPELPTSGLPRPSQEAQAGEMWEALLRLCPPAHREVITLKRQGLTPGEIADRAGLHEGSVRRILYELARRLTAEQGRPPRGDALASRGGGDGPAGG